MSNCPCNKPATELLLPATRTPSQIQSRQVAVTRRHMRDGGGVPRASHIVSATQGLGISACQKAFPDFGCVKQVQACFTIVQGTNGDGDCCAKCPSPPPEPECAFPLPPPTPCCPSDCSSSCSDEPATPPPPCKCTPFCEKVHKIQFRDPCDPTSCQWAILPDACGSHSLLFQCDGCDKALLDCAGDLNLLGKLETTALCFAPVPATPTKQWCLISNPTSGALQLDCIDRTDPLPSDQLTPQTISFTKAGAITQSAVDVTFTPSIVFFPFSSNALPATIIAHNPSLLLNKQVKINAGVYNGQTVTVVNVDAVVLQVVLNGITKNLGGDALLTAVWSTVSARWISSV